MSEHNFTVLPTDKKHISFSEMSDWLACPWRHKLKNIDKIDLNVKSVYLDYGTAVHASCENFLKTRKMDISIALDHIKQAFEESGEEFAKTHGPNLEECIAQITSSLGDVVEFFNKTFPNWKCVDAEHYLYEKIDKHDNAFKGFIDAVIVCDGPRGKRVYWLLDWKTSTWGWKREKKSDFQTKSQLILYKNYWSRKLKVDPKKIKCGFILLKRTVKPGQHCELVEVSVGAVTTSRALKNINNMLVTMKKRFFFKNKTNCKWCDYKQTKHCPGTECVG